MVVMPRLEREGLAARGSLMTRLSGMLSAANTMIMSLTDHRVIGNRSLSCDMRRRDDKTRGALKV